MLTPGVVHAAAVTLLACSIAMGTRNAASEEDTHAHALKAKASFAVYFYNLGGYDQWDTAGLELPAGVDGYIYSFQGEAPQSFKDEVSSLGWQVIETNSEAATMQVTSPRLTAKRLKWQCPDELRTYDYVLTHDASVRVNYKLLPTFLAKHAGEVDAIFKKWPYEDTCNGEAPVFCEMGSMLTKRKQYLRTSRKETIAWRAELAANKDYDLTKYFESDVFVFKPSSAAFTAASSFVFNKCHILQRDQFVVPFAMQFGGVSTTHLDQNVFESELGYQPSRSHLDRNL